MHRRIVSAITSILVISALFGGCSGNNGGSNVSTGIGDKQEPTYQTGDKAEGKTIDGNETGQKAVDRASEQANSEETEKNKQDNMLENDAATIHGSAGKDADDAAKPEELKTGESEKADDTRAETGGNTALTSDGAGANEQKPVQTSASGEEKKGLLALSPEELKAKLDEIYPGPSLTQEWIDRLPAEKLYEYFGQKYGDNFFDYVRTGERIIDESTVECLIEVQTSDGIKKHKAVIQVNGENKWNVISEEEIK